MEAGNLKRKLDARDLRKRLKCSLTKSEACIRGRSNTPSRYKCRGCSKLEVKESVVSEP